MLKNGRKKSAILAWFLSAAVMFLTVGPAAAADIQVVLDGQNINDRFEVQPVVVDDNILVPLRAIFEAMDASVEWDGDTQTALAFKGNTSVVLPLGSMNPTVNSVMWTLPVPAQAIDGHILAPLRFVGEAFGGSAQWDGANNTAIISSNAADTPAQSGFSATAVTAAFAPAQCSLSLDADADTANYGSVPLTVEGSGNIDADGSAQTHVNISSTSFTFNLVMGEQDKTMSGCPFSELVYGPAADAEQLGSSLDLSEDANCYYLTGSADDFPSSVYDLLNNVISGVTFQSASGDYVVTVEKSSLRVSQVSLSSFTADGTSTSFGDVHLTGSGSLDYSY